MNNAARAFVFRPDSQGIADKLNAKRADVCAHNRRPCYLRCGVERVGRQVAGHFIEEWQPIPLGLRLNWLLGLLHEVGNHDSL